MMTQRSENTGPPPSSPDQPPNYEPDKSESQLDPPINQHVMALVTFLALLPLVYFVPDWVGQFLPDIKWLNVTVAVAIIVPIISYIVMPVARWVLNRGFRD